MPDNEKTEAGKGYGALVAAVRNYHRTLGGKNLAWRKEQLRALKKMLRENEALFLYALKKDLNVNPTEGGLLQLGVVASEIDHALKHIDRWTKPQKIKTPLHFKPASAKIVPEPLGVSLIIGAWNYPLLLTLSPLVGCIAAGNAAIIKPSELAPATATLIAELLPKYLDLKAFQVVIGGVPEATALLAEKFDKIFFTGSSKIGKIVMTAAAKNLTPVTLELGGQSPVIVDKSANLKVAALRIVFAKFANAGQTCVAPNHIFVHEEVAEKFTAILKKTIKDFYGDNPQKSPDYGRIVDKRNFERLTSLIKSENVAYGGNSDPNDLYIAPTLLTCVGLTDSVMQEEIFGPILPIIKVRDVSEAFNHVATHDRPLAAYVFTKDKKVIQTAEEMTAGAICINNAMIHLGVHDLPFGGVGESGFGQYHGKAGFDSFSHQKPILKSSEIEPGIHYPPHKSAFKKSVLKFLGLL